MGGEGGKASQWGGGCRAPEKYIRSSPPRCWPLSHLHAGGLIFRVQGCQAPGWTPLYPGPSLSTSLWFGWGDRGKFLVNSHQSLQVPELTSFWKKCGHVRPCLPWAQKGGGRLASESSPSVGTIPDSSPTSQPEGMDGWTDRLRLVEGFGSQPPSGHLLPRISKHLSLG